MDDYEVRSVIEPDENLCEAVYASLREHNAAASPEFWRARELPENDPSPISLFAFDSSGNVVGGLFGSTQFAWLKIEIMATNADLRGKGIGTQLVKLAETMALDRGCKYSFVDTMEHQAPGFYEKLGYTIVGQIDDWDSHGHAKFYLTKSL